MPELMMPREMYLEQYPVPSGLPDRVLRPGRESEGGFDCGAWAQEMNERNELLGGVVSGLADPFDKPLEGWRVAEAIRWRWRQEALELKPERLPLLDMERLRGEVRLDLAGKVTRCRGVSLSNMRWDGSASWDREEFLAAEDRWMVEVGVKTARSPDDFGGVSGTVPPRSEAVRQWCSIARRWCLAGPRFTEIEKGWGMFTALVTRETVLCSVFRAMRVGESQTLTLPGDPRTMEVRRGLVSYEVTICYRVGEHGARREEAWWTPKDVVEAYLREAGFDRRRQSQSPV
jgi:hypothetical protein